MSERKKEMWGEEEGAGCKKGKGKMGRMGIWGWVILGVVGGRGVV